MKVLSAKHAASLDHKLMSEDGAFTLDQYTLPLNNPMADIFRLMELAGLSVSQVVYRTFPPNTHKRVFVLSGPGANGGDGLVAARHLKGFGYDPAVFYPKPSKGETYVRLQKQLHNMNIPILSSTEEFSDNMQKCHCVLDALFGFSFRGPVRAPFEPVINEIAKTCKPVVAVDVPSSWDVDNGPPSGGCGKGYLPSVLVSLTSPKPCAKFFKKEGHKHFLGGRFVPENIANEFQLDLPPYPGSEQIVDITDVEIIVE